MLKFSYSKKQYYRSKALLLIVPLSLILLSLIVLYYDIPLMFKSMSVFLGVLAFFAGYYIRPYASKKIKQLDDKFDAVYDKFEKPLLKERDTALRGMVGEETIGTWLEELLPQDKYMILPNLVLPNYKSDIDFVVVGPKGIFVFEVKNYAQQLFFTTEDYAVILDDGRIVKQPLENDPREQLKWNAGRLEKYLDEKGIKGVKAKKALIFPEPESMKFLGSPAVYLIDNKNSLKWYLDNNNVDSKFSDELCAKIVDLLK